ncbi:MAG: hypothetical protein JWL90_1045 [Chthoniobacteraceae bacterium]|nr:hypothetical protein [Chthoniobacteraceae bacterium]
MKTDSGQIATAHVAAEEILRTIYGDDLLGCSVRPEAIASIIQETLAQQLEIDREMLGVYEKAIEALHLLSTPPANKPAGPGELSTLLGERLDAVRDLTRRLLDTAASIKQPRINAHQTEE